MTTTPSIRDARTRLELTQQQLADALGVHRVSVARWESGAEEIPQAITLAVEALTRRANVGRARRK